MTTSAIASTGVAGLDDILGGGLTPNRLYLYVTLSETQEEIRAVAESHGWSLDGIAIRELVPSANPAPA